MLRRPASSITEAFRSCASPAIVCRVGGSIPISPALAARQASPTSTQEPVSASELSRPTD